MSNNSLESKGYLYASTGIKYVEEAVKSAEQLKQVDPNASIALITDEPFQQHVFDEVIVISVDRSYSNWQKDFKSLALIHSPFEYTFYIDSDVYFIEECTELFDLLAYHDLLIAHAPADIRPVMVNNVPLKGYMAYNCGLIVYKKNNNTTKLFKDWYSKCLTSEVDGDQPPFMQALLESNIKHYILQSLYNLRIPFTVSVPGVKVKILHGRHKNMQWLAHKVNQRDSVQRSWDPLNQCMHYFMPVSKMNYIARFLNRLRVMS